MRVCLWVLCLACLCTGCVTSRKDATAGSPADKEELSFSAEGLAKMQTSLKPISPQAKAIRSRIGDNFLEPPDLVFMSHIDSIIASIGAGKVIQPDYSRSRSLMNEQRLAVESYRLAMAYWLKGWSTERAKEDLLVDPAIINEVYHDLGEPDKEKKEMVTMVVARLDPVTRDLSKPNEIYMLLGAWESKETTSLSERLFHQVTMLDFGTWKMVPNIKAIMTNIGAKEKKKELYGWVANPANKPALRLRIRALSNWLAGQSADSSSERAIMDKLGSRNAYKEKVWLASLLLQYLNTHQK